MSVNKEAYHRIQKFLSEKNVALVAVSKSKPVEDILELYRLGHRDFGENYVQELLEKARQLPADIRWHFIGHLQTNKVRSIAPFVQLIQSVDSLKLLKEIEKQGEKLGRTIPCLLQVQIAEEETKFGLDEPELTAFIGQAGSLDRRFVKIEGLMGMASLTEDMEKVRNEFRQLKKLSDKYCDAQTLSMGMSADYKIAIEEGSTMVRIGSLLFGERVE